VSTQPQAYRGETLGLPEHGPGSLAQGGRRLGAFLVDGIASSVIAGLFTHSFGSDAASQLPRLWSLLPWAIDYVLGMLLLGRTVGMYLFGLRIIRVDRGLDSDAVNPWRAVVRTALLFILVPALVWDRDGRGLQDRFTDTAVVNG
jgi:uncharacterized RDD family membrane protein YckC